MLNRLRSLFARFKSARPVSPDQTCLTGPCGLVWRRDVWPGLVRYSLFVQRKNAGWRVYVHRFSVLDSEVHNHPWAWSFSFILRGQYTEVWCDHQPDPARMARRVIRWFNFIPHSRHHQVTELGHAGAVWTLFVCGPSIENEHTGGQ